jgi:hypothetical protein
MFWVPFRAKRKHASARRLAKTAAGRAAAAS